MVYHCESSKSLQSFPQALLFWGVLEGVEVGVFLFFFNNSIHYLFYICLGYSSLGYTLSSYVFGAPSSECGLHSPLGRSDDAAAQTADSSTVPQTVCYW